MTRPVAQLSDKSRVNSSSYRNEALASHGGSQVLNVAPQTERNPGHSGAMADASKAAGAVERKPSSAHRGVSWSKAKGKWEARIGIGGGQEKYLGRFETQAAAVRIALACRLGCCCWPRWASC